MAPLPDIFHRQKLVRPLFVSSFPPRQCGIATFTRDLGTAISEHHAHPLHVIAVEPADQSEEYGPAVIGRIRRDQGRDYLHQALLINQSEATVVALQHEFGLFGGSEGHYILDFAEALEKPLTVTFHTILSNPTAEQRHIQARLGTLADRIIAMTPSGRRRLVELYGIPAKKIALIHHGVTVPASNQSIHREQLNWQNKQVLLMTGLLGPDKGADYVIRALPAILKQVPNAYFVIAGATHPEIRRHHGEAYRTELAELAFRLGVADHIEFLNRYLPLTELMQLYDACDVYLTPHLNPEQITSGTLAYALGMGKACVSTPYVHAKDLLRHGRGLLVDFRSASGIAQAVTTILTNPGRRADIERRAKRLGQAMAWPTVAEQYLNLFQLIRGEQQTDKERYAAPELAAP